MPITKSTAFAALICFLFFSGFCKVYSQRYGRVISFGDSLSDAGNYNRYKIATSTDGKGLLGEEHGYFGGRASNGYLWCEQLFNQQDPKDNYAYLGAEAAHFTHLQEAATMGFAINEIPSLDAQIDIALYASHEEIPTTIQTLYHTNEFNLKFNSLPTNQARMEYLSNAYKEIYANFKNYKPLKKIDSDTLCTIWIGMNDLRSLRSNIANPTESDVINCIENSVKHIHFGINRLIQAGAKHFVVCGLPTIFHTSDNHAQEESVVKLHNLNLWKELQKVSQEHPDINIIPIDIATLGEIIVSGQHDLGIENFDEKKVSVTISRTGKKTVNKSVNPNTSLFWDSKGHLTAAGNKLLAKYIRMIIEAPQTVVPQMRACEAVASQAGRNVATRLFHHRGSLHPLSTTASALMGTAFTPLSHTAVNHVANNDDPAFLRSFMAKKGFSPHSYDAVQEKKLQALPTLNLDGDGSGKFGIFLSGDLYHGKQDDQGGSEGYRHKAKTVTLGGDYKFTDAMLTGIAMSYTKADTKLNHDAGEIDLDGYTVSLFNSCKKWGFYLDSALSYGWNQIHNRRRAIAFNQIAKSDPIGMNWGASGLLGYDFTYNNFKMGPTAGVKYGHTKIMSYREDGATISNMIVGEQRTQTCVGSFGGHLSYTHKTDDCGTWTPTFRGSYEREFKNRSRLLVTELAAIRGVPYRLPIKNNDKNYYRLGAGLNWLSSKRYSIGFDYETIIARKNSRDHFLFAKLRYVF